MARTRNATRPEVGAPAPEFSLPSAQGGNLRLGMRTVRGPVIVAFFRGAHSEEDVEFFRALAAREDEINAALGSIVGVGVLEPEAAREFQRAVGMKSYILYDYTKTIVAEWGVSTNDGDHGSQALPSTFIVDTEHKISSAWPDSRPTVDELLAAITAITGLPKEEEPGSEDKDKDEPDEGSVKSEGKPSRTAKKRRKAEEEGEGGDSDAGSGVASEGGD